MNPSVSNPKKGLISTYDPNWVIINHLARSARPGRDLGPDRSVPQVVVDEWLKKLRVMGIRSIICLLNNEHLRLYEGLPDNLVNYYRLAGFKVIHLPLCDPTQIAEGWKELEKALDKAWRTYQEMPKPVLVHCSAGRDRTGKVVNYICKCLGEKIPGDCNLHDSK